MKKILFFLLTFCMSIFSLHVSAQDLGDYTFSTGTDASKWITLSSPTSLITSTGDYAVSTVHNLGFSFTLGEDSYTQFSVNADGNLRFGSTVTGTSNYTTPFSSSNASVNAPKINFLGCDGYMTDSGHVYHEVVGAAPNRICVIEFATSTYTTTSRNSVLRWQVQLFEGSNDIQIVYAPTTPPILPAVTRQQGISLSGTDLWLVNANHQATHYTVGQSTTIASGNWPNANRYYLFSAPTYTCPGVTALAVSNIDASSAELTWTPVGTETTWDIYVSTSTTDIPDINSTPTDYVSGTPSYILSPLAANTTYTVYVRANCGTGDVSGWRSVSFDTPCEALTTLPWFTNLDSETGSTGTSVATSNLPNCWNHINAGTSTSYSGYPMIYNNTTYSASGSNALRFYTYTTAGTYDSQYAVLPPVDGSVYPLNTLQVSFDARANSTSYTFQLIVGILTNPTDRNSFEPITTLNITSTTYNNFEIPFDTYTGNGTYIAIMAPQPTSGYNYGYIDNITIETIPTCPKPTHVTISNITAEGANIDWTPGDQESSWEVVAVPTGSAVTDGTPETASSHPYTISGLDDATTYDIYVRANCGNEYSSWTSPASFTTNPLCSSPLNVTINQITGTSAMVSWTSALYGAINYTVEYSESGQNNWNMQIANGTQYMISDLQPNTNYDVMVYSNCDLGTADTITRSFTTHCLTGGDPFTEGTITTYTIPVNNFYHYSYTQQIYLASEMGGASTIDSIAFDYAYSTASTDKTNVVIYLGHTSQSTFSGSSNYIPSTNLQQVYSGHLNCHQGWNTFVLSTPFQYNGTDNLVLVVDDNSDAYDGNSYTFNVHNAGANRTLYFYSDSYNPAPSNPTSAGASSSTTSNRSNVKFFIPCDNTATCIAPNVYVTEVTSESITVDWAPGLSESSWEMEYSTNNSTWTSLGTVNTHPYDVDNLDANTNYYIRLRSNCGSEYSDWATVSARTSCSSVDIPYTENFDDAPASGSGNMVYCWTRNTNNTSTAYPYTSSGQHHSGTYSVYFQGTTSYYSYIASPLFNDNVQMDNLQVRFWAYKTSSNYYIQVGIMTDPNDYSTFVQVGQDISPSANSTWEMFEVNTDNYTGNGQYIAFRIPVGATNYMYIDDIEVDNIPLCAHVTNLHTIASSITATAADIAWTAGGDETAWQVVYGPAGTIIDPELETAENVYTTDISLSDLSGNTLYDVYVKAVCASENSIWMHISFRTDCGIVTALPFVDNFDTYGTGTSAYPTCWTKINTYTGGDRPYINTTNYSSPGCLYFYTGTSGTYNIAVTPRFDATIPINTLQATFMYRAYYASDRLIVGVMTDSADANTFVPIETIAPDASYTTWVEREVDFSQYTGNGQFIAFKNAYTSTSGYAYVDNLTIDLIPSCPKPRQVRFTNLTSEGADVDWTSHGTENAWEVIVVPAGHAISEGTAESVYNHPYTLTGLNDETAYDVYVRADCGGGDYSAWSTPGNFTTTPLCSSPTNVTVTHIAGASALVSWDAPQYGALNYTVEYTVTGQNNWITETTDDTELMLSGLDPSTDYTVKVSSNCNEGTASPVQKTFTTGCLAGGNLQIGDGTTTNSYLPSYSLYNYGYSQQIFTSSEMGGPTTIHSISFNMANLSQQRTMKIYLMHTNQSSISSWIPASSSQLVFSGSQTLHTGWNTFTFTTPFVYNGSDNLLLTVVDETGSYVSGNTWYVHTVSSNIARYTYQDGSAYSITTTPSAAGTATNVRNNVIFGSDCDNNVTCVAPNAYIAEVTSESITINWAPGYTENEWELEYSTNGTTWTSAGSVTAPYVLDNLTPDTKYYVRIRSNCGSEYSNWLTLSTRTACSDITVPYTQNFDDAPGTGSGNMVTCWTRNTNNTSTAYPYTSTSYHHSGNYSVYFYGTSSYYSYIASPRIDDDIDMNNLQVSFWAYKTSTSAYSIQVGIMTDPDDYSSFVQIGSNIAPSASSTWELFEVNTNNYTGNGRYIAFRVPAGSTNYMYIDDVNIDYIPTCPHVTNIHTVGTVTASTANIAWTAGGNETEWEVVYGASGSIIDPEMETPEYLQTAGLSLTNLSPSTLYTVYIKAICSSENSVWMPFSFRTDCGEISTLPFTDNFDTYGTGTTAYPDCWSKINTYTSGDRPYISTTNYSAPGSMYFYTSTSGTYNIAVTPKFDVNIPINTLQATFMYRASSSTDRLIVGVMTDSADASTFVPIETIAPATTASTWVEKEVVFSQYTGNGQFIAFKNAYTSTTAYAYIDNLTIDLIPSCPKPRNITFSNLTSEGANVNWTPYGEETAWEVIVVPTGHAISEGTTLQASTHPFTLTGLEDETTYDVYVRAACDGGEYSAWSTPGSFTTTPLCSSPVNLTVSQIAGTSALVSWGSALYGATGYTVEYSEAGQNNWVTATTDDTQYMLSSLDPTTNYAVRVTSNCPNGTASPVQTTFTTGCLVGGNLQIGNGNNITSGYLPEYSLYNYSYTQQIYLSSELNGAAEISSIAFNAQTIEDANRHLKIYLMHTSAASSAWLSASSATLVYDATPTLTTGWNTFTFTTPFQYNGNDNLAVIMIDATGTWEGTNSFYCHTTSQSLSHYIYEDDNPYSISTIPGSGTTTTSRNNVKFGMPCDDNPACVAPNAYVSEVTSESITINWAPGYTENAWEMEYSTDQSNWTSVGSVTAPYDLDNLTPDTRYYVRIHSNCGSEYSNWVNLSTRTACSDITVPYTQNFDDAPGTGSGNMVTCWTRNTSNTSTAYPYTSSSYHHSGNYSVYFYGTTSYYSYIASPRIVDGIDMDNLQVSFWAYKTSAAYSIQVGIMTDPDDYNTFVQIGSNISPSATSSWEMFEVNTDSYTGNGRYIAFRVPAGSTNSMYIDDININYIPTCLHVTDIHSVGVITSTTANITWTAGDNESDWEVVFGEAGTISNPDMETSDNVQTNSIALSNLTSNTAYDVYVRAICSSDDHSTWMLYSFRTACDEISTLPYTDNFDTYGTGTTIYPPCWYKKNTYTGGDRPYISATNYSAPGSMYFYTSTSGTYNIAITPLFDASIPINTLQATFMYRASSSTDKLIVGVMTNPTDASTFVPVDTVYPASTASQWIEKEVAFNEYNGDGQYIAFKNAYTTATAYAYIDNLYINLIPSCPKPQDVHVLDATTSSIELGWTETGSATSWEIAYGAPGFDPDGTNATIVTATSNPFTVSNLDNSTTYEFYVRALCSSTDISYWSNSISAATTMIPTSLPYTADFSDPSDAWVLNNGSCTNYWVRGTVNNNAALFVTDNGTTPNYSGSTAAVAALKLFTVGTADSITISFDIVVNGESYYDYFKLFLAPPTQQFPAATSISSDHFGYNSYSTNAYNFYANGYGTQSSYPYVLNLKTTTTHVTAKMVNPNTNPNANSTALMALTWKNDLSVFNNPPATITNLTVTADGSGPVVTDPTVTTGTASSITQTTATLNATITNPSNVNITAKGFEWKLTNGGTYTQIAGTGTGNTFTANLTELTSNTGYTVKAFITFNGTTSYGSEVTFNTLPEDVDPCYAPTGLTISNVTANSATASWTPGGSETAWNIQYKLQSASQWQEANVQQPTYDIEGLSAASTYDVRVKAICSADNQSDFVTTTFTTGVGIDNITLANSINLMPNPADNYIDLTINSNVDVKEAVVYNAFGQMIQTVELTDNHARIDLSNMAAGMYFVRVNSDNVSATKKFIRK